MGSVGDKFGGRWKSHVILIQWLLHFGSLFDPLGAHRLFLLGLVLVSDFRAGYFPGLESRDWRPETGDRRLETGDWRLETRD